jgi:nitrate/nitrite transport system substrate-binding protein
VQTGCEGPLAAFLFFRSVQMENYMTKSKSNRRFTQGRLMPALMAGFMAACVMAPYGAHAAMLDVEKDELKFGFIKLTDMAPLAIA